MSKKPRKAKKRRSRRADQRGAALQRLYASEVRGRPQRTITLLRGLDPDGRRVKRYALPLTEHELWALCTGRLPETVKRAARKVTEAIGGRQG